jgi:putative FmdB family regulatory protein
MPLYEYECDACGQRFEVIRKFSESNLSECTLCGKGPVRRLMSSPAIQFKGTGWYITDYSSKGKSSEAATSSKGETTKTETKTEAGSTDATASKAESAGANAAPKSSSET